MPDAQEPIAVARGFHAALEAGRHGESLRELLTPTATFIEHPNLVNPQGGTTGVEEILAGSTAGAELLSSQRFELRDAQAFGDPAVLRVTWSGTAASAAGPLAEGQVLVAHLAQFVTVTDGLGDRIETFDCCEPFPTKAE